MDKTGSFCVQSSTKGTAPLSPLFSQHSRTEKKMNQFLTCSKHSTTRYSKNNEPVLFPCSWAHHQNVFLPVEKQHFPLFAQKSLQSDCYLMM